MHASVVRLRAQMRALADKKHLALHFHGPRDHLDASIHDYQVCFRIASCAASACHPAFGGQACFCVEHKWSWPRVQKVAVQKVADRRAPATCWYARPGRHCARSRESCKAARDWLVPMSS